MVGGIGLFAWSALHTVSAWSIFTLPEHPQIDNHILCTVMDGMCYIVYGCVHLKQHDVMKIALHVMLYFTYIYVQCLTYTVHIHICRYITHTCTCLPAYVKKHTLTRTYSACCREQDSSKHAAARVEHAATVQNSMP